MTKYNKLVRDNIPEIIRAQGLEPKTHVLNPGAEIVDALSDKLVEEAEEVRETPTAEEIGDLEEVLGALKRELGLSDEDVDAARKTKLEERGGFSDRIYLESVED